MINKIYKKVLGKMDLASVFGAAVLLVGSMGGATYVLANSTSTFTLAVNPGTLVTDIRSASTTPVASPSFTLGAMNTSFSCQTTTGTFGNNSNRIYVDNLSAANNGWTLAVAATGVTSTWASGTSAYFDFNDPTGSGCGDGGDTDSYAGQLTLNPSVASTVADYTTGNSTTGISVGSLASFTESGSTTSITLAQASNSAPTVWRGYFTGIGISQTIPAEQVQGAYIIQMVLTAVAL